METIQQIKQQIASAFIADSDVIELYSLDTSKTFDEQFSKVSVENLLFYIVASIIYLRELAHTYWLQDIELTALATRYGTKQWYYSQSLAFQKDDALQLSSNGSLVYATTDEEKQIIKYVAVVEKGRTVYVRVATISNDELAPLSNQELSQFQAYLNDIKPLGIRVVAQSYEPCTLNITASIYYNPQLSSADIEDKVTANIKDYLQNITFGGVLYANKLIDAIQDVDGVNDVVLSSCSYDNHGQQGTLNRTLLAESGYYRVNNLSLNLIPEQ